MPSTKDLVEAARLGETSAFAELVHRYERAAIITAKSVLGDFHLSQDVTQEAFVAAYQMLNRLHDGAAFGPWLLKIVRRRALHVQHDRRADQSTAECDDPAANEMPDWLEPYEEVVQQIARLPEHERVVTVLRYVDGRTINEIANAIGRPVGTITKQLSRAIERLRHWLVEVKS